MNLHHQQEFFRLMCGLLYAPLKTSFSMKWFAVIWNKKDQIKPYEVCNICGTSACALGHAPFFCTTEIDDGMGWFEYAEDAFGIESDMDAIYILVFNPSWSNDIQQAAARIFHGFHKGWPDNVDDDQFYNHLGTFDVPTEQQVEALSKKLGVPIVREVVAV